MPKKKNKNQSKQTFIANFPTSLEHSRLNWHFYLSNLCTKMWKSYIWVLLSLQNATLNIDSGPESSQFDSKGSWKRQVTIRGRATKKLLWVYVPGTKAMNVGCWGVRICWRVWGPIRCGVTHLDWINGLSWTGSRWLLTFQYGLWQKQGSESKRSQLLWQWKSSGSCHHQASCRILAASVWCIGAPTAPIHWRLYQDEKKTT